MNVVHTNETNEQKAVPDDLMQGYSIERLSESFESSARRWELIVYPSLFAFIILAAYGFYLVYSLAKDVHYLAVSVDTNMTLLARNMQSVSQNMNHMTLNIQTMSGHMEEINHKMAILKPMLTNIDSMDNSIQSMSRTTYEMRSDISRMNNNISRPMNFMNSFMPW